MHSGAHRHSQDPNMFHFCEARCDAISLHLFGVLTPYNLDVNPVDTSVLYREVQFLISGFLVRLTSLTDQAIIRGSIKQATDLCLAQNG